MKRVAQLVVGTLTVLVTLLAALVAGVRLLEILLTTGVRLIATWDGPGTGPVVRLHVLDGYLPGLTVGSAALAALWAWLYRRWSYRDPGTRRSTDDRRDTVEL